MSKRKPGGPLSMTGYGRGEASMAGCTWVAELRTVNHRFLDTRIILPRGFTSLEERARKLISTSQERGRVELVLQQAGEEGGSMRIGLNLNLAAQYHRCLQQINEELGLGYHITLADMLTLKDIISQQELTPDFEEVWQVMAEAIHGALDNCRTMREQEGRTLCDELHSRLRRFAQTVAIIEQQVPEILRIRQQELKNRLERLLSGVDLDPLRLAQEAAILADKADITEELVRLKSHISQFEEFLALGEPVGRRLDFLLQEFLREVNTLASKISSAAVAHQAVELKNEVEKLKEQVQNIE